MEHAAVSRMIRHKLFVPGDVLIYYHGWAQWEKPKDQVWFDSLSEHECSLLKPSDEIWVDVDPLYHHGKVYGRVLVNIVSVGDMIQYLSPTVTGSSRFNASKFAVLSDEEQVFTWSNAHHNARHVR